MLKPLKNLWPDLTKDLELQLTSKIKKIELKRGDTIYKQGDIPNSIYMIESGLVGLFLIGAKSGKEHLLRFFRDGQFFGHRSMFSNETYHGTTVALVPTIISVLPKNVILEAIDRDARLLYPFVQVLSRELRQAELQHVLILENEILGRTAQALIYLKDLHPEHNWTRQEIANFCASTVSTIIKALAELENLNLIEQEGRSIRILNREGLLALQDAEFN